MNEIFKTQMNKPVFDTREASAFLSVSAFLIQQCDFYDSNKLYYVEKAENVC